MQPIFFTGGYDDCILRWDVSASNILQRTTFEFTMNRMVISPDATYLAVASNPHVKIYDVKTRMVAPIKSYEAHKGNVTGIGISREGQFIHHQKMEHVKYGNHRHVQLIEIYHLDHLVIVLSFILI